MNYQLLLYMDTDLKKIYMKRKDAYQLNLINNDFQDDYLEISIELLMELINKNIKIDFLKMQNKTLRKK